MTGETPEKGTPASGAEAPASFRYTLSREAGSTVRLAVDVDADRVKRATARVFQRRVREAKIPGFRPGKAPRAIYERTFGTEHLWHEAAEDTIDETYREIVQREDLSPLDRPDVEIAKLAEGEPLAYSATVSVRPEVAFGDYRAHGATVEPDPVTDEAVEKTIAGMREHHAELRPVERPAAPGDVVTVDIDATIEGKHLELGRNAHLELGRQYSVPGLAEGLVGASAGGERTLELTFPEDADAEVRGKTGAFTVKVSQVAEKILPDLDDGFAKTVGVSDLAALRKAVRSELAHGAFHEARDLAAEKLMQHLLTTSTVEVPDVLIQDEIDHLMLDLRERLKEQGITFEQFLLQARKTEDEIRADWRPAAERRARSLLILDALAKREEVTVSGTELAQEVALTPLARQDPNALRNPAVLASMARSMRNRRVVDKLIGLDDPDAERDLIRKAGGDVEATPDEAPSAPKLVVPEKSDATVEGREAIRSLLTKP